MADISAESAPFALSSKSSKRACLELQSVLACWQLIPTPLASPVRLHEVSPFDRTYEGDSVTSLRRNDATSIASRDDWRLSTGALVYKFATRSLTGTSAIPERFEIQFNALSALHQARRRFALRTARYGTNCKHSTRNFVSLDRRACLRALSSRHDDSRCRQLDRVVLAKPDETASFGLRFVRRALGRSAARDWAGGLMITRSGPSAAQPSASRCDEHAFRPRRRRLCRFTQ